MCPLMNIGRDFEGNPITVWIPGPGDEEIATGSERSKLSQEEAEELIDSFSEAAQRQEGGE